MRTSFLHWRSKPLSRLRFLIASFVSSPCLRAFVFPIGAPDPTAPPCMRQRFLPCTAGDLQGAPERVLAHSVGWPAWGRNCEGDWSFFGLAYHGSWALHGFTHQGDCWRHGFGECWPG